MSALGDEYQDLKTRFVRVEPILTLPEKNNSFTDVRIVSKDGSSYFVHRIVLIFFSKYLKQLFKELSPPCESEQVVITEFSSDDIQQFITLLYTGICTTSGSPRLIDVLKAFGNGGSTSDAMGYDLPNAFQMELKGATSPSYDPHQTMNFNYDNGSVCHENLFVQLYVDGEDDNQCKDEVLKMNLKDPKDTDAKKKADMKRDLSTTPTEVIGLKPNQCPICLSVLGSSTWFKRHLRQHEAKTKDILESDVSSKENRGAQSFKCSKCQLTCSTAGSLKRHTNTIHKRKAMEVVVVAKRKPGSKHKCDLCQKLFSTLGSLNHHVNTIHNRFRADPSFSCSLCKKIFTSESDRLSHETDYHFQDITSDNQDCDENHDRESNQDENSTDEIWKPVLRRKRRRPQYKCSECQKAFSCDGLLKHHVETIHKGVFEVLSFTCSICPEAFKSNLSRLRHENNHHSTNHDVNIKKTPTVRSKVNIPCIFCKQIIIGANHPRFATHIGSVHKVIHQWKTSDDNIKKWSGSRTSDAIYTPKYSCVQCEFHTCDILEFSSHQRLEVHEGVSFLLSCTHCTAEFSEMVNARAHFLMHERSEKQKNADDKVICPKCDKPFLRALLKDHLATHDLNDGVPTVKLFVCTVCGRKFAIKRYLINHMSVHLNAGKFKCDYENCKSVFSCSRRLRIHQYLHSGEKKYECLPCGKTFTGHSGYMYHKRSVHEKRFNNLCNICGKSFVRSTQLKYHMTTHNPNAPRLYKCDVCEYSATSPANLVKHKDYHKERKYVCTVCGLRFYKTGHLKTHMGSHERQNYKLTLSSSYM